MYVKINAAKNKNERKSSSQIYILLFIKKR
jgi:hypothetical protein